MRRSHARRAEQPSRELSSRAERTPPHAALFRDDSFVSRMHAASSPPPSSAAALTWRQAQRCERTEAVRRRSPFASAPPPLGVPSAPSPPAPPSLSRAVAVPLTAHLARLAAKPASFPPESRGLHLRYLVGARPVPMAPRNARRGATRRGAACAPGSEAQLECLAPLPAPVVRQILALVPLDTRLRCREVSKAWGAALADPSLWRDVDLVDLAAENVPTQRSTALLRCAAALSDGTVESVRVYSESLGLQPHCLDFMAALTDAKRGGLLRSIDLADAEHSEEYLHGAVVERILTAVPEVTRFFTGLHPQSFETARAMLRREGLFRALVVKNLILDRESGALDDAAIAELMRDMHAAQAQGWLETVRFEHLELGQGAMDALADAVRACGVDKLCLYACRLTPACTPALVSMAGTLERFYIERSPTFLHGAACGAQFGAALSVSTSLRTLRLRDVGLFGDPEAGLALLESLTEEYDLLDLAFLDIGDNLVFVDVWREYIGAALAKIVRSAPLLDAVDISSCDLRDEGVQPIVEAMYECTSLKTVLLFGNTLSAAFQRDTLFPFAVASTGLRNLHATAEQPLDFASLAVAAVQLRAAGVAVGTAIAADA